MRETVKNSKGFSLIEVLVAMAILALCAAPFLRSLVLSIQTNAKSRELLNATSVAENIMEDIKADGAAVYLGLTTPSGGIPPSDTNPYGNVYKTGYDNYLLDGKSYKVAVTLAASGKAPDGSLTAYNSEKLAELYRMNTLTDAIYVQPSTEALEQVTHYVNAPGTPVADYLQAPDNIMAGLESDYEFDISYNDSLYEVNGTLIYQTASGNQVTQKSMSVYNSLHGGGKLQRIYLFLSPSVTNNVTIKNTDGVPVEVYLVRQTNTAAKVNLTIEEDKVHGGGIADPVMTKIRTNIGESDGVWTNFSYSGTTLSYTAMKERFGMYALDKIADTADTRLYDVKIVVSDKEGKELTSLAGTVLQ